MHMFFRTVWIFLRKRFLTSTSFSETTEISMRVLPTDLDFLMHVNNGVYFSYMDFGRWNMIFRNGCFDLAMKKGWYTVVAAETIKFKRSLKLWDKFTIQTKIMGHDERYFFIRQRFLKEDQVMAIGLVKVRFLKKAGGTVAVEEVLDQFKDAIIENEAQGLSETWANMEKKYLTSG